MSKSLSPRIEIELKQAVEDIAGSDWTINETAAKLIEIGVAVRESNAEPEITGPFGLPRPFAKISLGDRMTELRTEVDDKLASRLIKQFNNKPNTAAREALRLGVYTVAGEQFSIKGPEGGPRPFAKIDIGEVADERVVEMIQVLQERL